MRLIEWWKIYEEYQASRKTVQAWCSEKGVNNKTLYYRVRKVHEALLEQMEKQEIINAKLFL